MLVEMYEVGGFWYFKDENNVETTCGLGTNLKPLESNDPKTNLKIVRKLKNDGFTTEEILELFESKVL